MERKSSQSGHFWNLDRMFKFSFFYNQWSMIESNSTSIWSTRLSKMDSLIQRVYIWFVKKPITLRSLSKATETTKLRWIDTTAEKSDAYKGKCKQRTEIYLANGR